MTDIRHHIPEPMLAAYAAGTLPRAFELVIAAHISLCDECRAGLEAHEILGGALLDDTPCADLSEGLADRVMGLLDAPCAVREAPRRKGIYPGPVAEAMRNGAPRWKKLGMGVRQDILFHDKDGSARLLYIPPGAAVPDHGHRGTELTLVLQGAFNDETGYFGVGDLEVADE
ncbi:MAG TPA: transcriptional regulator, partial [Rhodobacteraceae bacterium]|nr:transcriptional regulator [Paracoccaceae bacterium]